MISQGLKGHRRWLGGLVGGGGCDGVQVHHAPTIGFNSVPANLLLCRRSLRGVVTVTVRRRERTEWVRRERGREGARKRGGGGGSGKKASERSHFLCP